MKEEQTEKEGWDKVGADQRELTGLEQLLAEE